MTLTHVAGSIDLRGGWRVVDERDEYRFDMALPGDVISAMHAADLIPDPYWGRNELDLRWICERGWALTREVALDRTDLVLVLSEVDTVATVKVNDVTVLEAANIHRGWRADISRAARIGINRIEIVLHSSVEAGRTLQAAQPYYVPFQGNNQPIPNGNMLRKPQCDFGWDWNIALAPMGIYGEMRLEPATAQRIGRLAIAQDHSGDGVRISVAAHLDGRTDEDTATVLLDFAGDVRSLAVPQGVQDPVVQAEFHVAEPVLWWPAGQGAQVLHDLSVTLGAQVEHRRIGLREIELESASDDIGRSFVLKVNGRPVFCKGANWIPPDALAGKTDRDAVADQLRSAVDANMNMIRIWGGGRYEPTWFHDLCDEMGLLVWQDFMFACNLYPCTDAFLTEIAAEVRDVTARLHHHASTALWCGDNELVGALSWFKESQQDRDRYLVAYDRLNREIELRLKETDPGAVWWPSSPTPGPLSFGDAWHDDTSGDMHFWSVWHEGRDFDHYRDVGPRFCSEFGFQSYPSMDVIRTFASPADFNISAPVFESHQKNHGGNARIAETMFRYFRFPMDFENFVYLSQVQQGLAIHTAVTHWRSLKPRCMGTLIWQLNDTWPVCSWASLDYGGGWKLLHHMAAKFFAPVHVSAVPEGDAVVLRAVNDRAAPVTVTLQARAVAMDGRSHMLGEVTATVTADAALEVLRVEDLEADEILVFSWTTSEGDTGADHFAPIPYKSYALEDPEVTMSTSPDGLTVTLSARTPAFFVALEADVPGRFSDNAFLLLPDAPAEITFTPRHPGARPNLTLRHLYSATCVAG